MPLLKYFVTVGIALTIGLFAISTYLEPASSQSAAKVSVAPTTTSLLHFGPPPAPPPKKAK